MRKGTTVMTDINLKEKIRWIYSELQGYLSQAPIANKPHDSIHDKLYWDQYNRSVEELSEVSGRDFSKFKIEPEAGFRSSHPNITINTYRQKLGGIVSRIHGQYFSDEPAPFSGMPSTVITQTQQQSQSVQMLLDIQSKIDEALHKVDIDPKEKNFLEKFKSTLSTVSSVTDLLKLCLKLAKEYGVSIGTLIKLFG